MCLVTLLILISCSTVTGTTTCVPAGRPGKQGTLNLVNFPTTFDMIHFSMPFLASAAIAKAKEFHDTQFFRFIY